eukprot:1338794-Pleurochrysis_carterae.AAC.1
MSAETESTFVAESCDADADAFRCSSGSAAMPAMEALARSAAKATCGGTICRSSRASQSRPQKKACSRSGRRGPPRRLAASCTRSASIRDEACFETRAR